MARFPRIYVEGTLYYVTSKSSSHSQGLFMDESDYKQYISLLSKYKNQHGFKLFAYALMPTHLHMLIESRNKIPISSIMHDINSLYTKVFNGRYGKKGHLFQERFKAVLSEKDPYLLPLIRHIHLGPERAKIVKSPKEYKYSSHMQFLDPGKREYPDMRKEVEETFTALKGREEAFKKYVEETDKRELKEFEKSVYKKNILGSKIFMEQVRKTIEEARKRRQNPPQKRISTMYLVLGSAAILIFAVTATVLHRQKTMFKNEYTKTALLYERTLKTLELEKKNAVLTQKDIERYVWKIELTERALEQLREEKEKTLKEAKSIEGYIWRINLTPTNGAAGTRGNTDIISIKDNYVTSQNMAREGFVRSRYSSKELKNGTVVWETIQRTPEGATCNWRGEWDGEKMKGIVRTIDPVGTTRIFSFKSVGERVKERK
ncbi:MAG: transposase [Candidatus Omnitrophota bacterium]